MTAARRGGAAAGSQLPAPFTPAMPGSVPARSGCPPGPALASRWPSAGAPACVFPWMPPAGAPSLRAQPPSAMTAAIAMSGARAHPLQAGGAAIGGAVVGPPWRLLGGRPHVGGLRALRPVDHVELDGLAFVQRAVAAGLDRAEMHEHVRPRLRADEAEPLVSVEPLDGSNGHECLSLPPSLGGSFNIHGHVPASARDKLDWDCDAKHEPAAARQGSRPEGAARLVHASLWTNSSRWIGSVRTRSDPGSAATAQARLLAWMVPAFMTSLRWRSGSVMTSSRWSGSPSTTSRSAIAPGATTPTWPSIRSSRAATVVAERITSAAGCTRDRRVNSLSWRRCMPPSRSVP